MGKESEKESGKNLKKNLNIYIYIIYVCITDSLYCIPKTNISQPYTNKIFFNKAGSSESHKHLGLSKRLLTPCGEGAWIASFHFAFLTLFGHQTPFCHILNIPNLLKECFLKHTLRNLDPGPDGDVVLAYTCSTLVTSSILSSNPTARLLKAGPQPCRSPPFPNIQHRPRGSLLSLVL